MSGLTSQAAERQNTPSLQLGSGGTRYPNQFFDLAQQYMPPTIKELFRWCTFYYYNSPLIGSSITKISRYPITDLIFEDEHESIRDIWKSLLVDNIKIKEQLMEINLDYHVYGNAFVSVHLPFTRFLVCGECGFRKTIGAWKWTFDSGDYSFRINCDECDHQGKADVHDVPYKDKKSVNIIRWNPENIMVKFNEYTGRRIYSYSVPSKLRTSIQRGDKDILQDIPLVVLEALRKKRLIRFSNDNFRHIRRPTLAEQDQGWGKPLIIHVLKDMFYLYTLRRSQEAIALEHIIPFDIIYPMPNAQADPYIHTSLSHWKNQIEGIIQQHRRDPNFKAVIPIPVGFGRLGGDGKAMMLSPEMNYLTQTIVGGMGIPQEFLFGGLNYTGSSISLRTLENDFIQNRSQLLDLVMWLKDKMRIWLDLPDIKGIRFADFRMADDVQRNQQLIGLNAQMKVSDQTMLTELGYNWEQEQRKMIEEVQFVNYLNDIRAKGSTKTQGESQIIQYNYQTKIQELAAKAEEENQKRIKSLEGPSPQQPDGPIMDAGWQQQAQSGLAGQGAEIQPGQDPLAMQGGQGAPGPQQPLNAAGSPAEQIVEGDIDSRVQRWATKIMQYDPNTASEVLMQLKQKMPQIGKAVEEAYLQARSQMATPGGNQSQSDPSQGPSQLPENKAPTGKGTGLV